MDNFSYAQPIRPEAVKQESDAEVQGVEDPRSPSPPRKRFRVTTATLPNRETPSYASGDLQDWHRNRSLESHPHSYSQVWSSSGWINASYPVGITQLESHQDGSYAPHDGYGGRNPDGFAPDGSLVIDKVLSIRS